MLSCRNEAERAEKTQRDRVKSLFYFEGKKDSAEFNIGEKYSLAAHPEKKEKSLMQFFSAVVCSLAKRGKLQPLND